MAETKPNNGPLVNAKTKAEKAGAAEARNNTRPLFIKPTTGHNVGLLSSANLQTLRAQFGKNANGDLKKAALLEGYNKYTPSTAASAAIKNGVKLIIPSKPQRQVFFPTSIPKPASLPTTGGRRKTRRSKKRSKKTRRRH